MFLSYSHSSCSCLSEPTRQSSCNVTAKVYLIIVEMIPLINPLLSSNPCNYKIKQQPVTSETCSSFSGWVLSFDL